MEKVNFSKSVRKLWDDKGEIVTEARLLDVLVVDMKDLSKYFLAYESDEGKLRLPSYGKCMLLIFLKPTELGKAKSFDLFTKLRKYSPQCYKSCKRNIGHVMKVHIAISGIIDGNQTDLFIDEED